MIRSSSNHLTAFALLLVPLALLAVLGGTELGRQAQRARRALEARAATLREQAVQQLQQEARWILEDVSDALAARPEASPAEAGRDLSRETPTIDGLIVLDDQARLLYPQVSRPGLTSLPATTDDPALLRAELLDLHGDSVGARDLLQSRVAARGGDWTPTGRARGALQLASLLRREGDEQAAAELYTSIDRWNPVGVNRLARRDALSIKLLARLALAELTPEPERDAALDGVLHELARGDWNLLSEDLIDAVWDRASEGRGRVLDPALQQLDAQRRADRAFAPTYAEFFEAALRRRITDSESTAGPVGLADTTSAPQTLLLLEPAPAADSNPAPKGLPAGARWIGIRVDLERFLDEGREDWIEDPDFRIELLDAGRDLPPDEGTAAVLASASTVSAGPFGLLVRATPKDVQATLRERSRQGWIRILLVIGLCATAAGGAVLLLRSVQRERELLGTRVELVGRVSHELRTPLALIRMYAETLGMGRARSEDQRRQFADVIVRESDSLSRMVHRILDFSASQRDGLRYHPEDLDVSTHLQQLADAFAPHLASRDAHLETSVEADLQAHVDADALSHAVVNLLENAVKYTPDDQDDRTVELEVAREGEEHLCVEIRDRGIGIPESERAAVFRGFHRASNAGEVRGAGIGLYLVRDFATAHGGTVDVLSREGGGTVLRIVLPRADDAASEDPAGNQS